MLRMANQKRPDGIAGAIMRLDVIQVGALFFLFFFFLRRVVGRCAQKRLLGVNGDGGQGVGGSRIGCGLLVTKNPPQRTKQGKGRTGQGATRWIQ